MYLSIYFISISTLQQYTIKYILNNTKLWTPLHCQYYIIKQYADDVQLLVKDQWNVEAVKFKVNFSKPSKFQENPEMSQIVFQDLHVRKDDQKKNQIKNCS